MGKVYSNGVTLPTGFKRQFPAPGLDDEIWEFVDDLETIPNQFIGMKVFIVEVEANYTLKSTGWQPEFDAETQNENDVINITSLELVSNTLTLGADSEWKIQGDDYTNVADFWLNIPNAATGQKRRDRVLLDQDNKMVLLQGAEHPVKAFLKPYNQKLFIEISQTDVDGASINVQPIELNAYVKKNEAGFNLLSYTNIVSLVNINEKGSYSFGGSQEVVNYVADFVYNSPLYDGKEIYLYNNQETPIVLTHNFSTGSAVARKFFFKGETDFVLQPQTGIKLKWFANLGFWVLVASQNGVNYSTDEILTGGTWIDGKPIYRKVLTASSVDGEGINFLDCSILNIATLKSLTGFASDGSDRYELNGNFNKSVAGGDFLLNTCSAFYSFDDGGIIYNQTAANLTTETYTRPEFDFTFIIEYTKTTD